MNIDVNKDFERDYKDDSWRGFSSKEAACIGVALAVCAGTCLALSMNFGISPENGVFPSILPAVPVLFWGFYTSQGMSVFELLKEIRYERNIQKLTYSAGEFQWTGILEWERMFEKERRRQEKDEKKRMAARRRAYKKQMKKGVR